VRVGLLGRRIPPRARDVLFQLALWVGFGLAYEAVRGVAGDDRAAAFADGHDLIRFERSLHTFFEPSLQHHVGHLPVLSFAVRVSYWASEFLVLFAALVWVYVRDRRCYIRFRDAVLVGNGLGLLGYLLLPTAPPRLFPAAGFLNRFSGQPSPGHSAGLIGFAANPYAAMPSIHAADALLIGLFAAAVATGRATKLLWLAWPPWVFFVVLASGNHFWTDVAAGVVAALGGLAGAAALERLRDSGRLRALRRGP
jgi:hypothetical protein